MEYVKRFYSLALGVDTSSWTGNADQYFATAAAKGLVRFSNPNAVPPAPNDILVFEGDTFGHVAIVTQVTQTQVEIIEQNWSPLGTANLQLTFAGGLYAVQSRGTYKILGWLRLPGVTTTYTFTGVPFNQFFNTSCPPTCRITGSITLAQPLPANISLPAGQLGGSSSSFAPLSFSFTDGVTTATNQTCSSDNIFNANTDANGNITQYAINVCFNHGGSYFYLSYDPPFGTLVGLNGTNSSGAYQAFFNDGSAASGGTWTLFAAH